MIRITNGITENELRKIEHKHWQWFKDSKLINLITKLSIHQFILLFKHNQQKFQIMNLLSSKTS